MARERTLGLPVHLAPIFLLLALMSPVGAFVIGPHLRLWLPRGSPSIEAPRGRCAATPRLSRSIGLWTELKAMSEMSSDENRQLALCALRNGDGAPKKDMAIEFAASLTAEQRALLHATSARLGLGHSSIGTGKLRRVKVWVKDLATRLRDLDDALAEEDRATRAAGLEPLAARKHAAAITKMRRGVSACRYAAEHAPHGPMARLLGFLFGSGSRGPPGDLDPAAAAAHGSMALHDKSLDAVQQLAVALCMGVVGSGPGVAIHGPPGVGKSRVLVEVIRQRVQRGQVRGAPRRCAC
jgi:hypothetical protein